MDLDQNFTLTRLERRFILSFSLTIFLVAAMVISTCTASVAYGQVGDTKVGVFNNTQTDSSGNTT